MVKSSGWWVAAIFSDETHYSCEKWLFAVNFSILFCNSLLMPVREALILPAGKQLQTDLMFYSTIASTLGTLLFSSCADRFGGHQTLVFFMVISVFVCFGSWMGLSFAWFSDFIPGLFYLFFTFYNMMSTSTFWIIAGDILSSSTSTSDEVISESQTLKGGAPTKGRFVQAFGKFAAGGTLGQMLGSSVATGLVQALGTINMLLVVACAFVLTALLTWGLLVHYSLPLGLGTQVASSVSDKLSTSQTRRSWFYQLVQESRDSLGVFVSIARDPLLALAFVYSMLLSMTLGLFVIERQFVATRAALSSKDYASLVGMSLFGQGLVQVFLQYYGTGVITATLGTRMSCALSAMGRLILFTTILFLQCGVFRDASNWYLGSQAGVLVVGVLLIGDISCRVANQTASKPLKESIWTLAPVTLKYRAKIVIDVFAHRAGTSVAAILSKFDAGPLLLRQWKGNIENHIFWGAISSFVYVLVAISLGATIDGVTLRRMRNEKPKSY